MDDSIMDYIARYYRATHELVLKVVDSLDDQQIMWRPNRTTPSIGFHVWHLTRWADYLQEMITDTGVQIWEKEELAGQWGFSDANLGFAETGMGLDDDVLASLPWPRKDVLLDYAHRAFTEADQAIGTISEDQFHRRVQDRHGAEWKELAIGDAVMSCAGSARRFWDSSSRPCQRAPPARLATSSSQTAITGWMGCSCL